MKVKALRDKKTKEFIHLQEMGGEPCVFTSELPMIQPMTATMEAMKDMMETTDFYEGLELDLDTVELVEFDLIESGEVGADIRNKLSPPLNLAKLIQIYFEEDDLKKLKLKDFLIKEAIITETSVDYLGKLF